VVEEVFDCISNGSICSCVHKKFDCHFWSG